MTHHRKNLPNDALVFFLPVVSVGLDIMVSKRFYIFNIRFFALATPQMVDALVLHLLIEQGLRRFLTHGSQIAPYLLKDRGNDVVAFLTVEDKLSGEEIQCLVMLLI